MVPTRDDAKDILCWGASQNPGPWVDHSKNVARAAETIAKQCGMDPERAYVSGLLHDIGYYSYRDGVGEACHIYVGYKLMLSKGYDVVARVCMTHSFPVQDIRAYGGSDMGDEGAEIAGLLSSYVYDDYDKLVQLCDCLCAAQGICTMEKRMIGVAMRHGFGDFTVKRWEAFFALRDYFNKKCRVNVYTLFRNEIIDDVFRGD